VHSSLARGVGEEFVATAKTVEKPEVTLTFETVPMPKDSPLLALGNVLLTRTGCVRQGRRADWVSAASLMQGILSVGNGELPNNILNPDMISRSGFREKLSRYHLALRD
jgi:hypothetical protein